MADDSTDQSQKTEEPTQKKLDEAKRKGQVASSREVNHWFMILAAAIVVMTFAHPMMREMKTIFSKFISHPHAIPVDMGNLRDTLSGTFLELGIAMIAPLGVLVLAALLSGVVQNGLVIAPERLMPKMEKISLKSGFKRLFSLKSIAEFLKGLFKLTIVGVTATLLVMPELDRVEQMTTYEIGEILDVIYALALKVLIGVVAIISIIAGLDFLYQKFEHIKSMRMSRQEIKDELKQTEGDPIIRARLRQIRQERARRRMMAAVPEASVVITNPTHFAVALRYELDDMNAPVLLAKGIDSLALKIKEIARDNDVPVVENPPLARALHAGVEVDQEIPEEHYRAVAEIIGYVMRLQGKLPPEPGSPRR